MMTSSPEQQQRNMSKSITRLLQHSILQLCNEHIGYTHKLQILGVLCMTVDDEQQELVVKVNNTLKRVNPTAPKDGPAVAPFAQNSTTSQLVPVTTHDGGAPCHQEASPPPPPPPPNGSSSSSVSPVPPPTSSSRRSHGRKGTNPVKVHHVYDEGEPPSDEDEEAPVTVIPEAPEASMGFSTTPLCQSPAPQSPTGQSQNQNPRQRMLALTELKAHGSAKRKAGHAFRVPPQFNNSPNGSPFSAHFRSVLADSMDSPYGGEGGADGDLGGADGTPNAGTSSQNNITNSSNSSGSSSGHGGLSIPIYVAGTYSQEGAEGDDSNQSNNSTATHNQEVNGNHGNGEPAANGLNLSTSSREGSYGTTDGGSSSVKIKSEPKENYNDYNSDQAMDLSSSDDLTRAHVINEVAAAYTNSLIPSGAGESLSQLPYSGLSLLAVSRQGEAIVRDADGLTIKYTSTGPYTVGANGKDVSNSSRIKDIILYDDQSPLSQQKGARIETDFIVDKLGLDGRKRRRRAPEDQLTPEEIAEYLGHDRESYSFKCKYCNDEFDSVTRYLHHSLASHQAYICHQCGKSFTTKSSLLRHRPIHTGMRRFACSICKKTFYRKDKCKAHIKRHLGSDPGTSVDRMEHIETAQIEVAE